MFLASRK